MPIDHVAIVGAGFSGTLQAINLLRHDGPRVTLIERRAAFARGVAYSTPNPAHLLNVRAANMSALPDDPEHFVRWLAAHGLGRPQTFALRSDYGDYLAELLETERLRAPQRLRLLRATADDVTLLDEGVRIRLDDGERIDADVAILALGNLPPHDPVAIDAAVLASPRYVANPWASDVAAGLGPADTVLVLGTGLTMVDVVLTLDEAGIDCPIVALSRRGLVPHPHADGPPPPRLPEGPSARGSMLVRLIRQRADAVGWRRAIDELRPYTQGMWLSATHQEQRRFIRHLRPWWDIHRHRLAPPVAARLAQLRASGRLRIEAGWLQECRLADDAITVAWRPRGSGDGEIARLDATRVLNCTGPQGDVARTREPLLNQLLSSGRIRADPHRFGIEVNAQGETIDSDGWPNPRLLALGPMTRGAFWEIVAVPELRQQTWTVARRLANAQLGEREGA